MDNRLVSLPPEICELRFLGLIGAPRNKLRALPPQIEKLNNLTLLDVSNNELSTLPAELGRLPHLYDLYLNDNPLTEPYLRLVSPDSSATARNVLAYLRGEPLQNEESNSGGDPEEAFAATAEQRPAAYRFGLRNDRVDTIPEVPQPRDNEFAINSYSEARAKSRSLHRRLEQTNSARRVVNSAEGVIEALGIEFTRLRPGLLLSRIRSLEADRAAFNSEEGRAELFPDALAMIDDALLSLRDLLAAFPIVREIEIERVALDLDRIPNNIPVIRRHAEEIVEAATESWRCLGPGLGGATPN